MLPADRPAGLTYVGLDLSRTELELAVPGSYDETVVADVADCQPSLRDRFDLIVSFQVLEHVRSLEAVLKNMQQYLKPGGHLLAQFSGTFSVFGLANRVTPQWLIQRLVDRLHDHHDSYQTFPAYYDKCWNSALEQLLRPWQSARITPYFAGLGYFEKVRPLRAGYLAWEEWIMAHEWKNLAPYYVIEAQR